MTATKSSQSVTGHVFRAVIVSLDGEPELEKPLGATWRDVVVTNGPLITINEKPRGMLYFAAVKARLRIHDGRTSIPAPARRLAESAIETVVRVMSIDRATGFSIKSPAVCVGFRPSRTTNWQAVQGLQVRVPWASARMGAGGAQFLLDQLEDGDLDDRLDGVALLSEARNSTSALGKYLSLVRLFERAFRLGPNALTEPLVAFLAPSQFRFRSEEVKSWTNARSASVHADRRDEFFLDSDVEPLLARMFEAAMEVLANKQRWRHKGADRRERWKPKSGSNGLDQFVVQGTVGSTITMTMTDGFRSFPLWIDAGPHHIGSALPRAAWLHSSSSKDDGTCTTRITGSEKVAIRILDELLDSKSDDHDSRPFSFNR